ncbi:hypothetical protein ASZ90_006598 [hydrocarbon metagenome]|uniref:RDD domain-containing protein n=1 Tax=hydrocarbon metagenome TaxID=938273 RepID=A0A0W8FS09_9ZZZZ
MTIYNFAGFWRRLIAFSIDNTIIIIIFSVLSIIAATAYVLGAIFSNSDAWIADLADPTSSISIMFISCLLYVVTIISYFTYFHGTTGRTPGKMLLGLQVVSADGTPVTFGTAFLRAVGYFISFIYFLGFFWAAFDKRKQGWHDKIAGTVVIIREPQNNTAGISIPEHPN